MHEVHAPLAHFPELDDLHAITNAAGPAVCHK